ncbi:hypothetical protein EDC04DRAFT_2891050 [Pisolithus marmoratus]|nr:hypothetical protein EDC04DRAFT_2891050 [Pisolithus marmoratus]
MSSCTFNITLRMIHLQAFNWLKQFVEGSIMMHMVLDSIEFVLRPNFDSDEWMDLTHCVVMELGCWSDIEKIFMWELGIEKSSSKLHVPPSGVLIMSGPQGSASEVPRSPDLLSVPSADPLLKDPSSEPGADNTVSDPLLIQRAMESHGVSLTAGCVPVLLAQAIHHCHSSSCGVTQKKCHKVKASIFLNIDAKDEGEQDEEGEEEDEEAEDEEDRTAKSTHCPQQVGTSGKESYREKIDTLFEWFSHGVQEGMSLHSPPGLQIPTGIFPPPCKNIYIVDFYLASARVFTVDSMWRPPVLSRCSGISPLLIAGAIKILFSCCCRKKSRYKGNIGYVGESTDSDAIVLVTPHQLPYDPPEESGERVRFDVELTRIADIDVMPILSSSGTKIGHTCGGQQFVHGLLRLPIPVDTLETVKLPHPDDIRFHVVAGIDLLIEIQEGDLRGKTGILANVDWHKQCAVILCDENAFECNLHELHRVFRIGDTVEVIAGPFCGEAGYIVALHEHTIVLIMQHDKTSDNIEVSKFVMQTHLNEHVLSLGPEGDEHQLPPISQQTKPCWVTLQNVVKAVDLTKASLDVMHVVDGVQMNVPITFVHKMKEHSDHGLLKFVGHDVWVIASDKKGSQATLHSLGRMFSWVAVFGQMIQLKNNQVATLLGMLLDGTLLPPQLQYTLKSLHH